MQLTYTSLAVAYSFFLGLIIIFTIFYLRAKHANRRRIDDANTQMQIRRNAFDNIIRSPHVPELSSNTALLDVPYTICYFNTPSDPTRWISTIDAPLASSSIVRRTRAVPVPGDECPSGTSTVMLFDLRKDASTINDGFNKSADEILALFLDKLYSIRVERDTVLKNLTYAPDTGTFQVSVMAVYRKPNGSYAPLMNRFKLASDGTLVNDPPQALERTEGLFTQINQRGTTILRNAVTRVLCICARSTGSNTLTLFIRQAIGSTQPKVVTFNVFGFTLTIPSPTGETTTTMEYTDAITTLSLDTTQSRYDWIILPDPTVASKIYFIAQGSGTVQIETLTQYSISAAGIPTMTNYLSTNPSIAQIQSGTNVPTISLV